MSKYIVNIISFGLGCFGSFFLPFHPVISSCLVGLMGSLFSRRISPVIYAGSFAGMSSQFRFESYMSLFAISFLGGSIYSIVLNRFNGIGGKLGTIAFVSVLLIILINGIVFRWS